MVSAKRGPSPPCSLDHVSCDVDRERNLFGDDNFLGTFAARNARIVSFLRRLTLTRCAINKKMVSR